MSFRDATKIPRSRGPYGQPSVTISRCVKAHGYEYIVLLFNKAAWKLLGFADERVFDLYRDRGGTFYVKVHKDGEHQVAKTTVNTGRAMVSRLEDNPLGIRDDDWNRVRRMKLENAGKGVFAFAPHEEGEEPRRATREGVFD